MEQCITSALWKANLHEMYIQLSDGFTKLISFKDSFISRRVIEYLIPEAHEGGRPRSADMREVINAIRYLLRTGCAWRLLPHDLPPWQTVYGYFHILPKRWIVERTFGWFGKYRRLSKDYERRTDNSEAFIKLAMINILFQRIRRT